MSQQKIIKRYISQKCIGYTASRNPIYNCLVEYMDGSTGIIEEIGEKTEDIAPYPARIQAKETPIYSIYSMIGMRQKLDQAVAQHGSDVQDRFTPLNCCILDYANQRLYSVDRLAYFQLDGDQVVLIQEEAQAQHG